jgi:hypothetical protein
MDILEAPDEIGGDDHPVVRHATTETWTAMPWERFEIVIPA